MQFKQDFEKDLEQRKADLKSRLKEITILTEDKDKKHFRCKGYYREIGLKYDMENFIFAPNDLIIDKHGVLSICVGVARSPDMIEGDVLWLFSEGESEIHYISSRIPKAIRRDYQLAA
jgi:hypothetical protein